MCIACQNYHVLASQHSETRKKKTENGNHAINFFSSKNKVGIFFIKELRGARGVVCVYVA